MAVLSLEKQVLGLIKKKGMDKGRTTICVR